MKKARRVLVWFPFTLICTTMCLGFVQVDPETGEAQEFTWMRACPPDGPTEPAEDEPTDGEPEDDMPPKPPDDPPPFAAWSGQSLPWPGLGEGLPNRR